MREWFKRFAIAEDCECTCARVFCAKLERTNEFTWANKFIDKTVNEAVPSIQAIFISLQPAVWIVFIFFSNATFQEVEDLINNNIIQTKRSAA